MKPADPSPVLASRALLVLRLAVAVLLGVHGYSRLLKGQVGGLGTFLTSEGLPLGLPLAWGITLFEMFGSVCLAWGRFVRLVVPAHVGILLGGILLVHGREGWFVVGGGRNGVEYSLLLIASLLAVWLATPAGSSRPSDPGLASGHQEG